MNISDTNTRSRVFFRRSDTHKQNRPENNDVFSSSFLFSVSHTYFFIISSDRTPRKKITKEDQKISETKKLDEELQFACVFFLLLLFSFFSLFLMCVFGLVFIFPSTIGFDDNFFVLFFLSSENRFVGNFGFLWFKRKKSKQKNWNNLKFYEMKPIFNMAESNCNILLKS